MNKTRPNKVIFRMSDQELELLNQRVKESGMAGQAGNVDCFASAWTQSYKCCW